jgi:hypothetical protein
MVRTDNEVLKRLRVKLQSATSIIQGLITELDSNKDSLTAPNLKTKTLLISGTVAASTIQTATHVTSDVESSGWNFYTVLKVCIELFECAGPHSLDTNRRERTEKFFKRLDENHVRTVFKKHSSNGESLRRDNLEPALIELGICVKGNGLDDLYRLLDLNHDGTLEFEEFQRALACSSEIEQWAASLPFAGLLACCLPPIGGGDGDATRELCAVTPEELAASLDAFATGARHLITERLQDLQAGFDELDRRVRVQECVNAVGGKFSSAGLEWGTIEDFHKGIQGRIGKCTFKFSTESAGRTPLALPFLVHSPLSRSQYVGCRFAGYPNPDIMAGIEAEHSSMYGADETLEMTIPSPTTPRKEFEFVIGRQECPPKQMVDGQGNTTRVIRPIDELQGERLTVKAGLMREEIIAVVCRFPASLPTLVPS